MSTSYKVLVIGDLILDRYIRCAPLKLCPEGPVPAVKRIEDRLELGAAANLAINLMRLGCDVKLVTAVAPGLAVIRATIEGVTRGVQVDVSALPDLLHGLPLVEEGALHEEQVGGPHCGEGSVRRSPPSSRPTTVWVPPGSGGG